MIGILCANLDANGGLEVVSKRLFNAFKKNYVDAKIYSCKHSDWENAKSFDTGNKLKKILIDQIVNCMRQDSIENLIIQLSDPFTCILANIELYKRLNNAGIKVFTVLHNSPKSFLVHYPYLFDIVLVTWLKTIKAKVLLAPRAKKIIKKLSLFSSFVSISKGCQKELENFFYVKSVVIPNYFDFFVMNMNLLLKKKHQFATICRIDYYQKNFLLLLDAWNNVLEKKDWILHIIGSGEKLFLKEYIKQKKIKNIEIDEALENSEVVKFLEHNSVLLITSYNEGFPTIAVEAAACGNAIITSKYDGFSNELIEHEQNGFVCSFNTEEYASRIQEIINSDDLRMSFQKKSLDKTLELSRIDIVSLWKSLFENHM